MTVRLGLSWRTLPNLHLAVRGGRVLESVSFLLVDLRAYSAAVHKATQRMEMGEERHGMHDLCQRPVVGASC